jgi:hypothetical protein
MKAAKALWLLSVFLALLAAPAAAQVLGGPVINGPGGNSITLTTSGTSGAATLSGGTLNVPVYSNGIPAQPSYPIALRATTTDPTATITPGYYTGSGGNASPWFAGYNFAGGVSAGTVNLGLIGDLPLVLPSGSLYLRTKCLTSQSLASGTIKYTISDASVSNSSDPSSVTLTAETQTSLGATTTDTLITTDTALSATLTADHTLVASLVLNATGTPAVTCYPELVIK